MSSSSMQMIRFAIKGLVPLMMHNRQLADPFNEYTQAIKELTDKGKKKTLADLKEISRLEFLGGLYLNDKGHPCVTADCLLGMLVAASKVRRKGPSATAGLACPDLSYPLLYTGPRLADKLFEDKRFVDWRGVGMQSGSTIFRTRPIFYDWSLSGLVQYNDELLDEKDVTDFLQIGGSIKGLLDGRPRFGRFSLEAIEAVREVA